METAQTVTAQPSEAPAQEPSQTQPNSPEISKAAQAFEAAARKERELWKQQQAIKQKEQELEARAKRSPTDEDLLLKARESVLKGLEENPAKFLKDARYDIKKLLDAASRGEPLEREKPQLDPDELRKQIREEIMGELSQKEQEQLQKQKEQEILSSFEKERDTYLDSNPEEYELVRSLPGGKGLINQAIEKHYAETGEVLSFADAAAQVEKSLENEVKSVLQLGKAKKLFSTLGEESAPDQSSSEQESSSPTLTNDFNQVETSGQRRQLTEQESKAEAAKLLRWV